MAKYKLHYASLSDDYTKEDIPSYKFTSVMDMSKWLMDLAVTNESTPRVYLMSFYDIQNEKDLIFVTEYYDTIIDIIKNTHYSFDVAFSDEIHIQEYESYEAAYKVALSMKEDVTDLCYNKD